MKCNDDDWHGSDKGNLSITAQAHIIIGSRRSWEKVRLLCCLIDRLLACLLALKWRMGMHWATVFLYIYTVTAQPYARWTRAPNQIMRKMREYLSPLLPRALYLSARRPDDFL